MRKQVQSLTSELYLEDKGTIDMDIFILSSGDTEAEVKVWDDKKKEHTWTGTPEEFWNLIHKGMSKEQKNCRLENLEVSAYGYTTTIKAILKTLTDEQLADTFSAVYADLLQEGIIDKSKERRKENA